ncbi:hypothetical protein V9657_001926 [Vibrio vulnificus]|nr:hypothetical protein [Vibrio vulnificus]HDY8179555.1 hypothetical protein [Vibrio vulnificus]
MKEIAVGLLSYARTDLLIETLKCIRSEDFKIKIYLINNNHDQCILDDIIHYIDKRAELKYHWFGENLGVARGRRKLLELCSESHMILLDDDIHIEGFNNICQSVSDTFSDKRVGGIAFHIQEYGKNTANRYEIPHKNKSFDLNKDQDTYIMIGAGHAIDVEFARRVGNYPEDFGLYGFEEVDLSFRIINEGRTIRYLHNCVVKHKKSPDGRFGNKLVNYLAFVNRTKMAKRYLKLHHFIACYFIRSTFFIMKTRDFHLFWKGSKEIFKDRVVNKKFGKAFYSYIDKCNGFLWY